MTDIKTREKLKNSIKTFDRAENAVRHMGSHGIKLKESAEEHVQTKEDSPLEYAENKSRLAIKRAGNRMYESGRRQAGATGHRISSKIQNRRKTQVIRRSTPEKTSRAAKKPVRKLQVKHVQAAKRNLVVRRQKMMQRKAAIRIARQTAVYVGRAVKLAASSIKALISAIIAGGWVAIVIIIICCFFGAALYLFGDSSDTGYIPVSEEVEQYSPLISRYAKEYGISEYTELIKAVMMQESGGRGSDPMQASECGYNTKYPHSPGAIKDPEYSIKCGVQMLEGVLKAAGCKSPSDMEHIRLALQGYNFGSGYITWALEKHGGYSKANAVEFSQMQAKKLGTKSYGDPDYVEHVLRYYPIGNTSYDIVNTGPGKLGLPIQNMKKINISSPFGHRKSPAESDRNIIKALISLFRRGLMCWHVKHASWSMQVGACKLEQRFR